MFNKFLLNLENFVVIGGQKNYTQNIFITSNWYKIDTFLQQFPNEFIHLFRHADYATYNTKFCITKRRTIEKALLIL